MIPVLSYCLVIMLYDKDILLCRKIMLLHCRSTLLHRKLVMRHGNTTLRHRRALFRLGKGVLLREKPSLQVFCALFLVRRPLGRSGQAARGPNSRARILPRIKLIGFERERNRSTGRFRMPSSR